MPEKIKVVKSGIKSAPFLVKYDFSADRKTFKRKFFKSEIDAQNYADELNNEQNLPNELKFKNTDRIVFSQIKELCETNNIPLSRAYNFLVGKINEIRPVKDATFADAIIDYEKYLSAKKISGNTIRFYKQCLKTFFNANELKNVSEAAQCNPIEAFEKVKSPVHVKRALSPFLDWCVGKQYITSNPIKGLKLNMRLTAHKIPHILSIKNTKLLFELLPEAWKPAFALLAFAGLRPSEIIDASRPGILVSNIDFKNKRITIDVGKMSRKPRIILNAPANLWSWIAPLKGKEPSDTVAPGSYQSYINLMRKLPIDMPQDILRHSFGTYSYFKYGESVTKDIMGHGTQTNTLFKYYKGLGTPKDAEAYFNIKPQI